MKIFGSISELVDLAFRLAGGKQVKILSKTQSSAGNIITAQIPDVGATGDTQEIVLRKTIQTLLNKTLQDAVISGGTIDNAVIGGTTPADGSFTALVATTITGSGLATVNSLKVGSLSTGLLHSDSVGDITSSLLVNADVDAAAAISFSKLESLPQNEILLGSNTGVPTAVNVKSGSDISITYDAGEADIQIVAGSVGDNELAEDISRSKLAQGNPYKILVNDGSGEISENAALTANEVVASDANGLLTTISGVSSTELGYLDGVTSNIQNQIDSKADITTVSSLTTDDIAEGSNLYFTDARAKGAAVDDIITDGVVDVAPSQNAVFDALALKADSSSLGTIASQNSDNVSITGGSLSGVELDVLDQEVESVAISTNSLSISKGVVNVSGTGPINTLSSSLSSGSLVFLRNASGADLVVSNGLGNILTGTGADFDLLDGAVAPFLYDGTNWNLAGGAGAGGGAGTSREISQSLHGFSVGDVLYFDGSLYVKADASASSTAEVVGVVSEVKDSNTFVLLQSGYLEGLSSLTAGDVYFLSDSTPGLLTTVEPSIIGSVSKPVLIADSSTSGYVVNYRGVVVGGANARTQISLANNGSTNVQNFGDYDAAKLDGYVYINGTTDYRFYIEAQVSKSGDGLDYNLSYQTSGDTPPSGFDMAISSSGMLSLSLPDVAGYVSANINYALNAPAVGTSFPLSIDAAAVTGGVLDSARLPLSTAADDTQQYLVPEYREATVVMTNSGQGGTSPTMSGTLHIVKVGKLVTITSEGNITNTSSATPESADGVIPSWACPTSPYDVTNLFYNDGNGFQTGFVYPGGSIKIIYRNYSGTATAATGTARPFNISYYLF